jgi:hypothetical protein
MARISTYASDTTLEKSDKLLGSNADGTTKNFSLQEITSYLTSIGVGGKLASKFTDNNYDGYGSQLVGSFIVPNNDLASYPFSSLTTIRISKFPYGTEKPEALQRITTFVNETIIIANVNDINKFGLYSVASVTQVGSTDFYDIALAKSTTNGNLESGQYYTFETYQKILKFTHHQNSSATTWNINHNLGKFPSVSIKFSSSDSVYTNVGAFAGVVYTDEHNLTINLAAAESGYAYLN